MPQAIRILVADDDPDVLTLLRMYLSDADRYAPTLCSSPLDAAAKIKESPWDLLITDFHMPGMDGIELADLARTQHPGIPVLLTTAYPTMDTAIRAVRMSVTDFISKPLKRDTVLAAIETALASHDAQRRRVLAIGAHPDDVEIGAGGTLGQHVRSGDHVTILTASPGNVGGDPERRRQEAESAAKVLGARLILGDLADTLIPEGGSTIDLVESAVAEVRPDIVYVHSKNDVHQDHRSVHAATLVATRNVPKVLCYQSPSATIDFRPATFVALANLEQKLAAIAAYTSQTQTRDYLDPELLVATARYWGKSARSRFAEPFEVIREALEVDRG